MSRPVPHDGSRSARAVRSVCPPRRSSRRADPRRWRLRPVSRAVATATSAARMSTVRPTPATVPRERPAAERPTSGTTRARQPPQAQPARPGATGPPVEPRPRRAAGDRSRARRTLGRREATPCADPDAAAWGPPAQRVGPAAAHPRDERRRHRVARSARPQEGARADRGHVRRRARDEPVGRRALEDVHASASRAGAHCSTTGRSAGRSTARRPTRSASPSSATSTSGSTSSPPGINYGTNLGDDVTYSGTVSAAMEAVLSDCPAFAISQEFVDEPDFTLAGLVAAMAARQHPRAGPRPRRAAEHQRARRHPGGLRGRGRDADGQARLPGPARRTDRSAGRAVLLVRRPAPVGARGARHRLPGARQSLRHGDARSSST